MAGATKSKPRSGSLLWLAGMACGATLAFATPAALLGSVLLAPTFLAALFDTSPKRSVTRIVLVSASGFVMAPAWHLVANGGAMATALEMVTDPTVLCPAWLAAAIGWGVGEFLPFALRAGAERRTAIRVAALESEAALLRSSWDLETLEP